MTNSPRIRPKARPLVQPAPSAETQAEPHQPQAAADAAAPPEDDAQQAYAVGYCRPPTHTRFRKGQSGNPRGRPKAEADLRALVTGELSKRVTVRRNGSPVRVTKAAALATNLVNSAVTGDKSAISTLTKLLQASGDAPRPTKGAADKFREDTDQALSPALMGANELRTLANYLARMGVTACEDDAVSAEPGASGAPAFAQADQL